MEPEPDDKGLPRRFFFSTARDLYFLTYTLAVIVRATQGAKGGLVDPAKLAMLIPFVGDARLVDIVTRRKDGYPISLEDRASLNRAQVEARRLRPLVHRLLFSLADRQMLKVSGERPDTAEVSIPQGSKLHSLAGDAMFTYERQNMDRIRKLQHGLRKVNRETLEQKLFFESMEF